MTRRRAVIDPEKCEKASICLAREACPVQAIEREEDSEPYFVNAYCQGCGKCIDQCTGRAIKLL